MLTFLYARTRKHMLTQSLARLLFQFVRLTVWGDMFTSYSVQHTHGMVGFQRWFFSIFLARMEVKQRQLLLLRARGEQDGRTRSRNWSCREGNFLRSWTRDDCLIDTPLSYCARHTRCHGQLKSNPCNIEKNITIFNALKVAFPVG